MPFVPIRIADVLALGMRTAAAAFWIVHQIILPADTRATPRHLSPTAHVPGMGACWGGWGVAGAAPLIMEKTLSTA
jgi:hypothetical protein